MLVLQGTEKAAHGYTVKGTGLHLHLAVLLSVQSHFLRGLWGILQISNGCFIDEQNTCARMSFVLTPTCTGCAV